MQAGSSANGPGFVAGNVTLGAGKGTANGAPNVLVLLRNANNQIVKHTYTDINGDYSFSNLPMGSYNVYPESMPQVTTHSPVFTISATSTNVSGVDFTKNSKKIVPNSLGIAKADLVHAFSVYPNPTKDFVTIHALGNGIYVNTIQLFDMKGSVLLTEVNSSSSDFNLSLSAIPTGVYYLKITAGTTQQIEKLIIQK